MKYEKLIIYTDGGARGNPGPAGIGVAIYDEQRRLLETHKEYIGEATNNQAEYRAVLLALRQANKLGAGSIKFFLDSELVVRQLRGEYKIKNEGLQPLAEEVLKQASGFDAIDYAHVPREQNEVADKLVNEAIDERTEAAERSSG